ncbi:putative cysteine-rich receptor-like protein kinase 9 [Chenopodium quinoa]|uniref:putative cysteine-rich receptor-like protein kinase 9 n=1 Tax=Chenopodium quinoa TaxID=63459 RepID=UPI000B785DB0|nr:putative cysteine-rich receptor-like protein kinase 9 [Chenopodium quinoa]
MTLKDIQLHSRFIIWKVIPLLFIQLNSISADVVQVIDMCYGEFGNVTLDREYAGNVYQLLSNLSSKASYVKFYNSTVGETPNKVYGLFQCREDLSIQVCSECVDVAVEWMNVKCPLYKQAVVWYMECSLRFENSSISLNDTELYSIYFPISKPLTNYTEFAAVLATTVNDLIKDTVNSTSHFSIKNAPLPSSSQRLYSLAQCASDLNGPQCAFCLKQAVNKIFDGYRNESALSIFMPGCQLMYDTTIFYNASFLTSQSRGTGKRRKSLSASYVIGAIAICSAIGVILLLSATRFWLYRRKSIKMRSEVILRNSSAHESSQGSLTKFIL